ncbi:MAG: hypothetical protein P8H13_05955 [Polaribacter sp.]|nr:hypothetical protein [Polaribacter sp.]MDG1994573.1 hypothetical protein [Polaribacter sp.]
MKKLFLLSGIFLVILNSISLLIFDNYSIFNNLLVSTSVLITTVLLFLSANKKNADGYRIALSFIYSFLGIIKIIIAFNSKSNFRENYAIIWILIIVFIEIILLYLIEYMNKHVKN